MVLSDYTWYTSERRAININKLCRRGAKSFMTVLTKGPGNVYYRADRHFVKLPEGCHFGMVRAIAVDSQRHVYVGHRDLLYRDLPPIAIFSSEGNFLGGWGEDFFEGLHQIFITSDDHVFVVDTDRHQVFKFTIQGDLLMTLGNGRPCFDAPFNHPSDVAVSRNGDIYVADGDANTCIHKFSKEGEHLLSWGTAGKGPGQISTPHSIIVDRQERVFVGDRDTGRILVFTCTGDLLLNGLTSCGGQLPCSLTQSRFFIFLI